MRRLAWVLLALIAAWLVFVGGGWLGIYTTELRVITVSLAGLVLAGWAAVAWRDPAWRPRSVMAPAIVACLASMTISTIFSRVPRVSLEYLGYAILLAALYLLMVQLMARPFFRQRLVVLAGVMFVAVSVEYIAFVVFDWTQWWASVGHLAIPPLRPYSVSLTYGNPSAALTISALLAMPAAARWSSWTARGVTAFVVIVLTVGVVAIMSGSRSGWLALAVAALAGVVVGAMSSEVRRHVMAALAGRVAIPKWAPIAGAIVLIGVVGVFIVAAPGILLRAQSGGEEWRLTFYKAAVRMFVDSPVVGTGLGTWVIQRIAYTQPPDPDYYIPHAHDVPLQTLAEQGLLGAVAGLILVANLGALIWSAARSTDGDRRRWAWITALGLLYLAVHDLLDFYPNMPGILLAAALPVAYLDAKSPDGGRLLARPLPALVGMLGRPFVAVGILVLAIATGGLLAQEVPSSRLDAALDAATANKWQAAYDNATAAAAMDPAIGPYEFEAGLAASQVGRHDEAVRYFERVATDSDFPGAWLDLAAEQAQLQDSRGAIAALEKALRLGDLQPQIALPAGELARQLGDTELAVSAFAGAMSAAPSLAGDPWWQADSGRAAVFPRALAAAEAAATPDGRWEMAVVSGDRAAASALAANGSDPGLAAMVIAAWNGDDQAFAQLLQACSDHPLDYTGIAWCARLENRRGNATEASRFREQLNGLSGASAGSGLELRALTPDTKGPYLVPSYSYGWFIYTYRRDGPIDMLVPSLVHVRFA